MKLLPSYLLSLTAVTMIGVIASNLLKKGLLKQLVQISSGLLLLLVVLRPIYRIEPQWIDRYSEELIQRESHEQEYLALYRRKLSEQVRKTTEDYILSEAGKLGLKLTVTIELSEEEFPIPTGCEITGSLTREQQQTLSILIRDQIGIPQEKQRWQAYDETTAHAIQSDR